MKHLYFFMSEGIGINVWRTVGSLYRELALLDELINKGWKVTLITYDKDKQQVANTKVEIISMWPFGFLRGPLRIIYHWQVAIFRQPPKDEKAIMMTNQASLGWPAFIARKVWKLPLVARAGYVFGEQCTKSESLEKYELVRMTREKQLYLTANCGVVPTEALRNWLIDSYQIPASSLNIIPNYVDTRLFCPLPEIARQRFVLMVARLHPDKRISLVIEALAGTGVTLKIVGSGDLEAELKQLAVNVGVALQIIPKVEHKDLPAMMAQAGCFVISGLTEGHPKILIEAMACSMPCVGVQGQGINNVLSDKQTGLLVNPEPLELKQAILTLLDNPELAAQLGKSARNFSVENYSLEKIAEKYDALLTSLL